MALAVSSTRYAVLGAELIEDLPSGAGPAGGNVFKTSANTLAGLGFINQIMEALVVGKGFEGGASGVLAGGDELGG
jgi:hypothetical protein